ncbi:unnamed protein product [Staurois parvus]|uniref:Uncharacterized protein n=1 Tax=Staurois parvus TaxID=386267 RepID=A0ABN9AY63_9NEOB|nr:unnamed protein product [Staurois parvus]
MLRGTLTSTFILRGTLMGTNMLKGTLMGTFYTGAVSGFLLKDACVQAGSGSWRDSELQGAGHTRDVIAVMTTLLSSRSVIVG